MMKASLTSALLAISTLTPAAAQVELKTYANPDGYIDVQALTCAQLANTYQEDADYLTVWYSGWYNGLAKKHMMKVDRAKDLEHQIIVYCKEHQDKKVIQAIDVVFKDYRAQNGIQLKK
jgi:HdeA/HdeB family protein